MAFIDYVLKNSEPRTNDRGNQVYSEFIGSMDRLHFDFKECKGEDGWKQFDTEQDAWYFGVWIHVEKRMTVTYAEGDLTVVTCPSLETFRAELEDAEKFYGAVPCSLIGIDDDGQVTKYYDERPKV